MDEVTEFHSLASLHNRENNCFVVMLISTLGMIYRCTAVLLLGDKLTDRFRIIADNGEVFAHVNTLDHIVDHQ